jgi:hypothetical protein
VVNPQGVEAFPLVALLLLLLLLGLSRFRWVFGVVVEAFPPSGDASPQTLETGGG